MSDINYDVYVNYFDNNHEQIDHTTIYNFSTKKINQNTTCLPKNARIVSFVVNIHRLKEVYKTVVAAINSDYKCTMNDQVYCKLAFVQIYEGSELLENIL